MTRIPLADPRFDGNERAYLLDCLHSRQVSGSGDYIELFEERWAAMVGAKYGVACCNGTAALHLALLAMGVGPGDEVIVPDLTFVATANAVVMCGATPVFADVDPDTWTMQPQAVRERTGAATKGILPVHLYGQPADLGTLALNRPTYDGQQPFIVDDAAQAHGARYRGQTIGGLTDATTWSFHAAKIITTGEGGMVTTNNAEAAAMMRQLRDHGMDPERRFWHPIVGYNYRMTNMQAAIGLAQIERFPETLTRRRQVIAWYRQYFRGLPVQVPADPLGGENVCWLFGIVLPDDWNRAFFIAGLDEAGIETRPFFYPVHLLPPYAEATIANDCPVARRLSRQGLCLPMGPDLSEDTVERIVNTVARLGGW